MIVRFSYWLRTISRTVKQKLGRMSTSYSSTKSLHSPPFDKVVSILVGTPWSSSVLTMISKTKAGLFGLSSLDLASAIYLSFVVLVNPGQ